MRRAKSVWLWSVTAHGDKETGWKYQWAKGRWEIAVWLLRAKLTPESGKGRRRKSGPGRRAAAAHGLEVSWLWCYSFLCSTGLALKGKGTWRAEMVGSVEEFEHFTDFSLNTSTKPIQSREPWMRPLTAALGTDGTGDQPCSGCCSAPAHPSPRRLKDSNHISQREKEARMPFKNMKYGHIWSINKTRGSYRYMNIHISYETPIW